jgi:hypothetical protein
MTRLVLVTLPAFALLACTPAPAPDPGADLPFFGDGYRAEGDQCRRVGENDFTNQFLDDAADLVGCPAGMENLGVFVTETGAILVAQVGGTNLYSVPLR